MINRVISVISEFTADFTNFTLIKFYIFGYIGEKTWSYQTKICKADFALHISVFTC